MTMIEQAITIELKPQLAAAMEMVCKDNPDIELISLCTTDGFNINAASNGKVSVEADKLAAMASALCSLSSSCAKQIVNEAFSITTVETDNGNILFLSTRYLNLPCVLSFATKDEMSLANARFLAKRLAKYIPSITKN